LRKHDLIVRRQRGELVAMQAEGDPSTAIFFAARSADSGWAFNPVPTAGAPIARS
jgi:hypothetical protein